MKNISTKRFTMKNIVIRNSRVFIRLLLSYILIIVIVGAAFYPIYLEMFKAVRDSAVKDSYKSLEDGFRIFDNELIKIQDMAIALRNEKSFSSMVRLSDANLQSGDYYDMLLGQKFMRTVMLPTDIILDCYFIFKNNSMLISRDRIFDKRQEFYDRFFKVNEKTYDQWVDSISGYKNGNKPYFLSSNEIVLNIAQTPNERNEVLHKCITYIIPLPGNLSSGINDSALVCMLNTDKIIKLLGSMDILNNGFIFMKDNKGKILFEYGLNEKSIRSTKINILTKESGISEIKINNINTTLLSSELPKSGNRVIAGIPQKIFKNRIQGVIRLFLLYFLIAIIMGLFAAFFISYRKSLPIGQLINTISTLINTTNKKKNEYEYINEAFLELNSLKENYLEEIKGMEDSVKMSLYERLLRRVVYSQDEISESKKHLSFINKPYIVVVIKFENLKEIPEDLVKVITAGIIKQHFEQDVFILNVMPNKMVISISKEYLRNTEEIKEVFEVIAEDIFKKTSVDIKIGISTEGTGYEQVHLCYVQAFEATRSGNDNNYEVFVCSKDDVDPESGASSYLLSIDDIQKLYELLLSGETNSALSIIDSVCNKLSGKKSISEEVVRHVFYNVQNVILYASNELISDINKEKTQLAHLTEYSEDVSIKQLFQQLKDYTQKICEIVEGRKKSKNTKLKMEIIDYLKKNYPDANVCADSVAMHFDINKKYLFTFVKEQTGKSFGDYLENIRVENALKLLKDTQDSIGNIAEKVGFNSQNSFYKVFKRIFGISPGAWRERQDKGDIKQGDRHLV